MTTNTNNTHIHAELKTININGYEVPEPLRILPSIGTEYYLASITAVDSPWLLTWVNSSKEVNWLNNGLIHLTRKAAETHINALLSFTI